MPVVGRHLTRQGFPRQSPAGLRRRLQGRAQDAWSLPSASNCGETAACRR